jgi:V8-like Glu-specific endopeptidase
MKARTLVITGWIVTLTLLSGAAVTSSAAGSLPTGKNPQPALVSSKPSAQDLAGMSVSTQLTEDSHPLALNSEKNSPLGEVFPQGVIGSDDRLRISPTTHAPWRTIVSLEVRFGSQYVSCTGFFIGPRVVATAGHCVYDRAWGWANSVRVIPGRDGAVEPFGSQYATAGFTHRKWVEEGDAQLDFGAVQLPDTTLSSRVGWLRYGIFRDTGLPGLTANLAGYPGQEPTPFDCPQENLGLTACQLWYASGNIPVVTWEEIIQCPGGGEPCYIERKGIINYVMDTSVGQDGAPIWLYNGAQRVVVGIHTADWGDSRCATDSGPVNCGTLSTSTVAALFEYWGAEPYLPFITGPFVPEIPPTSTVKVVQLDTVASVPIRDIDNPIWADPEGDGSPNVSKPLAGVKGLGLVLNVTLKGFPADPSWTPKVEYQWKVKRGDIVETEAKYSFNGMNGTIGVTAPRKVGAYLLDIQVTIKDDSNKTVSNQTIGPLVLYVTLAEPIAVAYDGNAAPDEIWLRRATLWAQEADTPDKVMNKLNLGIYNNSAGWRYQDPSTSWRSLIEGWATQGNCVSFSNMWADLGKVLGVQGTTVVPTLGRYEAGFITKPATSLDKSLSPGNAHPPGGAVDRWFFGMHQVGVWGGKYYDPTFGKTYGGKEEFIEWHRTPDPPYADPTTGKARYNLIDLLPPIESHYLLVYTPGSPDDWGDYEYHSPAFSSEENPVGQAVFSGPFTDQGQDTDGDGLYNVLVVGANLNVTAGGDFGVVGVLKSGNIQITTRPSIYSSGFSTNRLSAQPGITTTSLLFSGQDIYDSGFNGPYTVTLALLDSNGVILDQESFSTNAYSNNTFREVVGAISSSNDFGEDIDGDGLYNFLTTPITLSIARPMTYGVEGTLYTGGQIVASATGSAYLGSGASAIPIRFAGTEIHRLKANGPYTLTVALYDDGHRQIDYADFRTAGYLSTQFQANSASLVGSYRDYGKDTDGDGLFDYLTLDVGTDVRSPGSYQVVGWLSNGVGEDVTFTTRDIFLSSGRQTVTLDFAGSAIFASGINGPYLIGYVAIVDGDHDLIDDQHNTHTTAAYRYTDFERGNLFTFLPLILK